MAPGLFGQPKKGDEGGEDRPGSPPAAAAAQGRVLPEGPQAPGARVDSLVAAGARVTGEIVAQGDLRIEGSVRGDVKVAGALFIAGGGSVRGGIEARTVTVEGRVEGTVTAREAARFRPGCRVKAEVKSPAVTLEEGGRLDGRLDMGGASAEGPGKGGA